MSFATGGVLSALGQAGADWGTATNRLAEIRRQQDEIAKRQKLEDLRVQIEQQRANESRAQGQYARDPARIAEDEKQRDEASKRRIAEIEAQAGNRKEDTQHHVLGNELPPNVTGADGRPFIPKPDQLYTVTTLQGGTIKAFPEGETNAQVNAQGAGERKIQIIMQTTGKTHDEAVQWEKDMMDDK